MIRPNVLSAAAAATISSALLLFPEIARCQTLAPPAPFVIVVDEGDDNSLPNGSISCLRWGTFNDTYGAALVGSPTSTAELTYQAQGWQWTCLDANGGAISSPPTTTTPIFGLPTPPCRFKFMDGGTAPVLPAYNVTSTAAIGLTSIQPLTKDQLFPKAANSVGVNAAVIFGEYTTDAHGNLVPVLVPSSDPNIPGLVPLTAAFSGGVNSKFFAIAPDHVYATTGTPLIWTGQVVNHAPGWTYNGPTWGQSTECIVIVYDNQNMKATPGTSNVYGNGVIKESLVPNFDVGGGGIWEDLMPDGTATPTNTFTDTLERWINHLPTPSDLANTVPDTSQTYICGEAIPPLSQPVRYLITNGRQFLPEILTTPLSPVFLIKISYAGASHDPVSGPPSP